MKVNLTQKLKSLDGKVMLMDPNDLKSEATLKKLIPVILLGAYAGDDKIGAEEKLRRYSIATKVNSSIKGDVDLTLEDITYIKKLAGIGCNTETYGQLCELLPK